MKQALLKSKGSGSSLIINNRTQNAAEKVNKTIDYDTHHIPKVLGQNKRKKNLLDTEMKINYQNFNKK